jgi:hypothetical protein
MEKQIYEKICNEIQSKYAFTKKIKPEIKLQQSGDYLMIFSSKQKTSNGHSFPLILRVIADKNGKIKKISSSK